MLHTHRVSIALILTLMCLVQPGPTVAQDRYSDDTKLLVSAFNKVAEVVDEKSAPSSSQFSEVMQISCETLRTVIERRVVVRQSALVQALEEKGGKDVADILSDDKRFEEFLVAEESALRKQGVTKQATRLALDLLRNQRENVVYRKSTPQLEIEDLTVIEQTTCKNAESKPNDAKVGSLHRKAWGAAKLLGGLAIVAVDVSAWIGSLGFSSPIAAVSGVAGSIIAADGYADLRDDQLARGVIFAP